MIIQVKKTHIRRGEQDNPNYCPIALSLKEVYGFGNVEINKDHIKIGRRKLALPLEAQAFIVAFDENKSAVKPFEFEL